jgi:hypothetical protein
VTCTGYGRDDYKVLVGIYQKIALTSSKQEEELKWAMNNIIRDFGLDLFVQNRAQWRDVVCTQRNFLCPWKLL